MLVDFWRRNADERLGFKARTQLAVLLIEQLEQGDQPFGGWLVLAGIAKKLKSI